MKKIVSFIIVTVFSQSLFAQYCEICVGPCRLGGSGHYKYGNIDQAFRDGHKASDLKLELVNGKATWVVDKSKGNTAKEQPSVRPRSNNTGGNSNYTTSSQPTYIYKGRDFKAKAARDAAIQADRRRQRENEQQQAATNAQRIEKEATNLRSQMKGTTSSGNTLALKGVNESSGNQLALRGVDNNLITERISIRPPASTSENVQSSKRPAKTDKIEVAETISRLSQKDVFNKTIDVSEELLSSMLEPKFKPEEYHLEAAVKQTIHLGVINPIKESAEEKIESGALNNSLLKNIPKESMIDEIKKDFIYMFSRGVSELQLIKLNYLDYERIEENILAFMKVEEKVVPNIWEYDKKAIKGVISGTRSQQQDKREWLEMNRKNLNTISEETRKTLK